MPSPPLIKAGDKGQRYELWMCHDGKEMRAGWSNRPDRFVTALHTFPGVTVVRVIDRQEPRNIRCCTCNNTSYYPEDVDNRYCGYCKTFLNAPVLKVVGNDES